MMPYSYKISIYKVVIRRRHDEKKHISPPGPDYIIIDVREEPEHTPSLE